MSQFIKISWCYYHEIEQSGGSLANGPLRALHSTVSKDPCQLKTFTSVLLQSEETVHVAKDTLKDYGMCN